MEEKLLKCPNCGANVTNHQNCEYCGSLLVRFVDKGIDLSQTSYASNAEVFPGLIQNLQQNLRMQENSDDSIVTDILRELGKEGNTNGSVIAVLRTGFCIWSDGQDINLGEGDIGFCIILGFDTNVDESDDDNRSFNQLQDEELARFEKLECFPLFTPHTSYYTDEDGYKRKGREYAIDFGKDVEGAARLISEIMQKVFDIPLTEKIEILTNQGNAAIDNARNEAIKARSHEVDDARNEADNARTHEVDDDNGVIPNWVWYVAVFFLFALIKACS